MKKILKFIIVFLIIFFLVYSCSRINVDADELSDELSKYQNYGGFPVPRTGYSTDGGINGPNYDYIYSTQNRANISDYHMTDKGGYFALKLPYFKLGPKGSDISFSFYENDEVWNPDNLDLKKPDIYYEGVVYLTLFDNTKFKFGSSDSKVGVYQYYYGAPFINNEDIITYTNYIREDGFLVSALHFQFKTINSFYDKILHLVVDTDDKSDYSSFQPYVLGYHLQLSSDKYILDDSNNGLILDSLSKDNAYEHKDYNGNYVPDDIGPVCDGFIDCFFYQIKQWWAEVLGDMAKNIKPYVVPDSSVMISLSNDFMNWFDTKLGFLGYPFEFTYNLINRFSNLEDTGHYIIKWPNVEVPNFNFNIINAGSYDLSDILKDNRIKNMHDVYLLLIDGFLSISFVMLCWRKYEQVLGANSNDTSETLVENEVSTTYYEKDKEPIHKVRDNIIKTTRSKVNHKNNDPLKKKR